MREVFDDWVLSVGEARGSCRDRHIQYTAIMTSTSKYSHLEPAQLDSTAITTSTTLAPQAQRTASARSTSSTTTPELYTVSDTSTNVMLVCLHTAIDVSRLHLSMRTFAFQSAAPVVTSFLEATGSGYRRRC